MQKFHGFYCLLAVLCCGSAIPLEASNHQQFEQVKNRVFAQPYKDLPHYKVTKKQFGQAGDQPDNLLLQAARRTLTSTADFIERPQQKLFNANGICFAGRWVITAESEFTGLFKQGTELPVIARASVALTGTTQKRKRAFGMAIKLFAPQESVSRNIFVLNSLVGVRTKHVLDLMMDNEPNATGLPPLSQLSTALRLRNDLSRADKEQGSGKAQVGYRTVYHIAEPILNSPTATSNDDVVAPYWFRLSADDLTPRVDANDFRDELNVTSYPNNTLKWQIEVAPSNDPNKKQDARWQSLGQLILTESVTSKACDQYLHFAHPHTRPLSE